MEKFRFRAFDSGVHLYFYGDIAGSGADKWSDDDVAPADVRDALLKAQGGEIILHVNSGGGDVFAAAAIANMLARQAGKKTCYVEGLAASAASVIALGCDEVVMPRNTMLMIHRASCWASGNTEELLTRSLALEKIDGQILDVYQSAAAEGVTRERLKALMEAESWLTAEESAALFANVRVDAPVQIAAAVALPASAPASIRELMAKGDEREALRLKLALYDYE